MTMKWLDISIDIDYPMGRQSLEYQDCKMTLSSPKGIIYV